MWIARKMIVAGCAGLTLSAALGCGQSGSPQGLNFDKSVDANAIELSDPFKELLGGIHDKAGDAASFAALFVDPKRAPKDTTMFKRHYFGLGQLPKIDGSKAKLNVEIGIPNRGDPVGATWDFEKVDGAWKIAAAPLPRGLR